MNGKGPGKDLFNRRQGKSSSDNVNNFDIYETMMMHVAVGLKVWPSTCGGLGHGEALAKYNELAGIEYRSSTLLREKCKTIIDLVTI